MINHIYQLIAAGTVSIKYEDISFGNKVIVRPEYMALCHADQRYFSGQRDAATMKKKLPMALIHECCGRVIYDPTGKLSVGQRVVLIPNTPPENYKGEIYENYVEGATFRSSGYDGFMQELVEINADRVVPFGDIDPKIAAITEFVSVCVHACRRFNAIAHSRQEHVGIWGDGSLAFTVANVIKAMFPEIKIAVVGMQRQKLAQFSFVEETYLSNELPSDFKIDHAFECCGGGGSYYAIEDIIAHIRPQGSLMLMGVSEHQVPINTRMVLEKGMTLVGSSRSGRADFEKAVEILEKRDIQHRLRVIIFEDKPVKNIEDIYRVFQSDLATPFKTVFKWEV
ncbi:MAG: alcohol dehydrogenase catalytic domain-containing protein [Clostridia bacterium]|nr:alcohol dehydrogenase catalytic domain-containing protein [Clostridia bacterium]